MDDLKLKLLARLQEGFPVVSRPFAEIGDELGVGESEVLASVRQLQSEGAIRRLGPIIDIRRAGGATTLAAVSVPPERLDEVGRLVSECDAVSHNYHREAKNATLPFNLWFTVSASSPDELEARINEISSSIGLPVQQLPMLRQFKIGVRFDIGPDTAGRQRPAPQTPQSPQTNAHSRQPQKLTEIDRKVLIRLQDGLPITQTPYAAASADLGITESDLFERLSALLHDGVIRRIGASLAHRKLGITANSMAVWAIDEDRIDDIGCRIAAFNEVTHCYSRPTLPDWPQNLYVMIHGRAEEECEAVIARIQAALDLPPPILAYSRREFKKTWSRLFE